MLQREQSLMAIESLQAPAKVAEQLAKNKPLIEEIVQQLNTLQPHSVMVVGRGSSDHAGVYAKYLIEIELGIPTFAAAPSVASVYNKSLNLNGCLVIIISQSGESPDIIEEAIRSKNSGALCIALLNEEKASLAQHVDWVIPLTAGKENSVAATKSYLATLSALLQLVALWSANKALLDAVEQIPEMLRSSSQSPIQLTGRDMNGVNSVVILGRGLGYAISKEMALKIKEVCATHAESFSSAEFLHGPVALVESKLKIIDVEVLDESQQVHNQQINALIQRGASLVHLQQYDKNLHPRIAPLAIMIRFYLDIEKIAREKGLNPDKPPGLTKVTQTY